MDWRCDGRYLPHARRGEQVQKRQKHISVDLHQHVHESGVGQKDHDLLRERDGSEQAGLLPGVETLRGRWRHLEPQTLAERRVRRERFCAR